jgi:hypothetical protein
MMITKRVALMFSGYRLSDFTDPAGAALSMCSVFEDYSDEIIKFATDPKTGVQRQCKWPPTINEVVEFCDAKVAYIAQMARFKNWGKSNTLMLEGPQEPKPTLDELKAKYGKDWGLGRDEARIKTMEPAPSWDRIVEHYQSDPSAIARLTGALIDAQRKIISRLWMAIWRISERRALRKPTSKKPPVTIPSQNVPALAQWWRTDIRVEHVHLHEGRQAILCAVIRAPKIET